MKLLLRVAVAAAAGCALSAGPAQAASLDITAGTLTYRGDPGEANALQIVPTDRGSCVSSGGCELFHYNAAGPYLGIYTYDHVTRGDVPVRRTGEATNCGTGRNPGVEFFCPLNRVSRLVIVGGDRDDHLNTLGTLPATIFAGDGQDRVRASVAGDVIVGGSGNDWIDSDGSDYFAKVPTGGGDDRVFGGIHNDEVVAGPGRDVIHGEADNDKLFGEDGDDLIEPGTQSDNVDGGPGSDTLSYADRNERVTVRLPDGDAFTGPQGETGESDSIRYIENAFGGNASDRLLGNSERNVLEGLEGDDVLWGRTGPDILRGGGGDDSLDGGTGPDYLEGLYGRDSLYTADSDVDDAHCGPQVDVLVADKSDKAVECETVRPAMVSATKVSLGRATSVSLPVRCFAIPPAKCTVTMDFFITPRVLRARARRVRIAHKRFKLPAGRRRAIRLRLSRPARRAVRRRGRLRVTARASLRIDGGPRVVVRRPLTIKRRR
jgi:hypothetical protein